MASVGFIGLGIMVRSFCHKSGVIWMNTIYYVISSSLSCNDISWFMLIGKRNGPQFTEKNIVAFCGVESLK